ncbi:MAG: class I SAM-dependent methyltransferase [Deltaproteobacteria bacterium]|nr:class I SAM-dependent methyltransferase [Deltaproteobacteria bacterium]
MSRFQVRTVAQRVADLAIVRPAAYLVRRLGFRQDVITRVNALAAEDSARYVLEKMMPCGVYDDRYPLFDLGTSRIAQEGLLLEFGVFNGRSINYVAKRIGGRPIFGFDSFEGLAEDWLGTGALKGRFTRGGVLPPVVSNVTLVKGWFNQTLPAFLAEHPGPIAFAHLDADTFESTKYVLDRIADRLRVGTILQFDEYLGYPGWRHGEHLAFAQLCAEHKLAYKYLGVGWMSVAVEITKVG